MLGAGSDVGASAVDTQRRALPLSLTGIGGINIFPLEDVPPHSQGPTDNQKQRGQRWADPGAVVS